MLTSGPPGNSLSPFFVFVLAVLVLRCSTGFSLVAVSRGYSLQAVRGILIVVAWALGSANSVVGALAGA